MSPYPKQTLFKRWIDEHGYKHNHIAALLDYHRNYLSRVLNGFDPLTTAFRDRAETRLGVTPDLWISKEDQNVTARPRAPN